MMFKLNYIFKSSIKAPQQEEKRPPLIKESLPETSEVKRSVTSSRKTEGLYIGGTSSLMRAATKGDLDQVLKLLTRGDRTDIIDKDGHTFEWYITQPDLNPTVNAKKRRLARVILTEMKVIPGTTPLMWAATHNRKDLVLDLLLLILAKSSDTTVRKSQIEATNFYGTTACAWGAHEGNLDSVMLLLVTGADPKFRNNHCENAITYA